jgi:hypothetical protein
MIAQSYATFDADKVPPMSHQRPTRDSMSLEEATVSNMWEIAGAHKLAQEWKPIKE